MEDYNISFMQFVLDSKISPPAAQSRPFWKVFYFKSFLPFILQYDYSVVYRKVWSTEWPGKTLHPKSWQLERFYFIRLLFFSELKFKMFRKVLTMEKLPSTCEGTTNFKKLGDSVPKLDRTSSAWTIAGDLTCLGPYILF